MQGASDDPWQEHGAAGRREPVEHASGLRRGKGGDALVPACPLVSGEGARAMTFTDRATGALELYVGPIAAELAHKQAELAVLKRGLAARGAELATFEGELNEFEIRYRHVLGHRYAILDDLAEQLDQVRLGDAATGDDAGGRGAGRDGHGGDDGPGGAHRDAMDDDGQNWAWAWGDREPEPEFRRVVSAEAKRLFRTLARLIHPDLARDPGERERRTNLMVAANSAYEQGDLETLRHLLDEWDQSPDSVVGSTPTAELKRTVRQIVRVCARMDGLDRRFATLESSAMGWLRRRVEKAADEGWDLLAHMVKELDRQISEARLELERIELERGNAETARA